MNDWLLSQGLFTWLFYSCDGLKLCLKCMNVLILLCKVLTPLANCFSCMISAFILCLRHQFLLNNLFLRILSTLRGLRCHYPISLINIHNWVRRGVHRLLLTQIVMMLWHLHSIESLARKSTLSCIFLGRPLSGRLVFPLFENRLKQLILLLLRVILIIIVVLVVSAECNLCLGSLNSLMRVLPII